MAKIEPCQCPGRRRRDRGPWAGTGRGARGENPGKVHSVGGVPKDAIVVTRPDGTAIDDPTSPNGKLMAPPRANFREVYAEGTQKPTVFQINEDIGHFGRFDYQRDKTSNTFYPAYKHASNYAAGVLMAGAGYTREETHDRSETFAYLFSSNYATDKVERQYWTYRGWDDAHDGIWK
jgi:hypothetical protein